MAAVEYQKITPISVNKLDDKELRKLYSGLRSILRKRVERAGKNAIYNVPPAVKDVKPDELKMAVSDLAAKLRDPGSRTKREKGKKVSPVTKSWKKLVQTFPELKRYQMKEFGKFMDMIRERMGERYAVSVVNQFSELKRTGVVMNTIASKYKDFLETDRNLNRLVEGMLAVKSNTGKIQSEDIDKFFKIKRDADGNIINKEEVL